METISDLQIEHPPIIHEDGRVEIERGSRKERSHKYEQPMKYLHRLFQEKKKNWNISVGEPGP